MIAEKQAIVLKMLEYLIKHKKNMTKEQEQAYREKILLLYKTD